MGRLDKIDVVGPLQAQKALSCSDSMIPSSVKSPPGDCSRSKEDWTKGIDQEFKRRQGCPPKAVETQVGKEKDVRPKGAHPYSLDSLQGHE